MGWWQRSVIDAGKLPLMLCFLAFVVTFLTTRTITRLIRDGRGPFHNISSAGTHIHHSIPGLILLIVGAFTSIAAPQNLGWRSVASVLIGIGMSLVLDEFALLLHLQDVYWSDEGQTSVGMVSLTAACLGLALVGFSPFGVEDVGGVESSLRLSATGLLIADGVLALVCVLKGKYSVALFGLFLPPIAVFGAIRLARPKSRWARRRYDAKRLEHATRRAAKFDKRWDRYLIDWEDFIGGKPSLPNPAAAPPGP
jgi:hypothetical protein